MTLPRIPLSTRSVSGYGGAVVSPHHLSTAAGISTLANGGNAVDAALAVNAVQGMVAPETCGIGGDLFALIAGPGTDGVLALNSSGRAGSGASELARDLRDSGAEAIPQHHSAAVSVPGCVDGWMALHARLGRLDLGEILAPAVRLGREGFPASRELANAFGARAAELSTEPSGRDLYPGGDPPQPGTRIRRVELASTLERIAEEGRNAIYAGPTGNALSDAVGGAITLDDLAHSQADWVEALSVDVFGLTAWTIPPNSQGYLTLATLAILERRGLSDLDDPLGWHWAIEAYRQAAADRDLLLADPDAMTVDPASLVSADRIEAMADRIADDSVAALSPPPSARGGTAYMCVIDVDGLGISLIQSNFYGIGSGISVPGAGFLLHDRARGFTLSPGHPNELAPGKRPLHTLSPSLWTRNGSLAGVVGTRGGHIQPQLMSQLTAHLFGHGLEPGDAMAVPRWSVPVPGPGHATSTVEVEPGTPEAVLDGLAHRGHELEIHKAPNSGWGPMSAIVLDAENLRRAASDPRVATTLAASL